MVNIVISLSKWNSKHDLNIITHLLPVLSYYLSYDHNIIRADAIETRPMLLNLSHAIVEW